MTVTIYHNPPSCGTSRCTLALIREKGIEPTIIEYLKTPLDKSQLKALIARTGVPVKGEPGRSERSGGPFAPANAAAAHGQMRREAGVRWKQKAEVAAAGIDEASSDDALLSAMAVTPSLMNRPIVVTDKGAKLCRPEELILSLL